MISTPNIGSRPNVPILNRASPQAVGLMAFHPIGGGVGLPTVEPLVGYRFTSVNSANAAEGNSLGGFGYPSSAGQALTGLIYSVSYTVATPLSMACWYRCHSTATGSRQLVIGFENVSGAGDGWFLSGCNDFGNKPGIFSSGVSGDRIDSTVAIATDVWTHLAMTLDGTNELIYQNGVQTGSKVGYAGFTATLQQVALAKSNVTTGPICHAAIWNRTLTANEIWALYDPRSRWDLYWQPSSRAYSFMSPPATPSVGRQRYLPVQGVA